MRLVEGLFVTTIATSCVVACAIDPRGTGTETDGDHDGASDGDGSGSGSGDTTLTPPKDPVAPAITRCTNAPAAGSAEGWRHYSSRLVVELGSPHHRGIDLIATTEDASQTLGGRVTYGPSDKDLEDEDVDVFACMSGAWQKLARVTTDDEGRFTLALTGAQRLPEGIRDLYLSVAGDRTGVSFVAMVAPKGTPVVVSDVDGTLTSSENAYPLSLVTGDTVVPQADASDRLNLAAQHGAMIVYITTRGDRFTQDSREWLAANGFPYGAMRLPSAIITLPGGEDTIEAKTAMLGDLAGFKLLAGVGNRHTDIEAYTNAGLDAAHIFVKLPEFMDEVETDLATGRATGIEQYIAMPM
jgi:phosphatidate phosphatase PAH1